MYKKFLVPSLIVGIALFLAGVVASSWVVSDQNKEKQLQQERQEKFDTDLDQLNRVVAGELDVHSFADTVPRENQQRDLEGSKARTETRELVLVVSIMCISMGAVISGFWLLLCIGRLIRRVVSYLSSFFPRVFGWRSQETDIKSGKKGADEQKKVLERRQERGSRVGEPKKGSRVLINSGWHGFDTSFANHYEPGPSEDIVGGSNESFFDSFAKDAGMGGVGLAKDKALVPEGFWTSRARDRNTGGRRLGQPRGTDEKTAMLDSRDDNSEVEDLVRTQTENLEKQMAEFKRMAQSVQQSAVEHSEPLKNHLEELTQQVSAIREYALQQQGRMEKLQDGYDWNIIRTFCLRIIRCIDNLETRITGLSEGDVETAKLKEVRDELIFALESSGIERFEPEIKSDYHGQERRAEAVREKQQCDDPQLKGKVAKVTRPGYQYVIDEENVKVVRTAQVELFDYVGQMK